MLADFYAANYTAPRMVLAAAGVEHDELVRPARCDCLAALPPSWLPCLPCLLPCNSADGVGLVRLQLWLCLHALLRSVAARRGRAAMALTTPQRTHTLHPAPPPAPPPQVRLAEPLLAAAPRTGSAAGEFPSQYVGGDWRQFAASPLTHAILAFEYQARVLCCAAKAAQFGFVCSSKP